jgi:hypothetical protein
MIVTPKYCCSRRPCLRSKQKIRVSSAFSVAPFPITNSAANFGEKNEDFWASLGYIAFQDGHLLHFNFKIYRLMQNSTHITELENQVFKVETKDFKTMMLSPDGLVLMNKNAADASTFWAAYEKGGLLNATAKVEPEKLKSIVLEQGEKKINLSYKSMLAMGVPGYLEFASEEELNAVLLYIEKKWGFTRTEKQLSPLKATLPYFGGLLLTIAATIYIIYLITNGGEVRVNVLVLLLIKIGEKIGPIGTAVAGLLISTLVCRAIWQAYKNPPVEVRLEPRDY